MHRLHSLTLLLLVLIAATPVDASQLVDTVRAIERGACPAEAPSLATLNGTLAGAHVARCWFDVGRHEDAAALTFRVDEAAARERAPIRVELDWFEELRARALLHTGRAEEAEQALEALIASPPGHETSRGVQARRAYYLALAIEAQGRGAEAAERYQRLLQEAPSSEYPSRVATRYVTTRWAPETALAAGTRALDGRHYEAAEALYRLAACGSDPCSPIDAVESGSAARREAAYQLGWLLYRFRREHVERALPWLETVAQSTTRRAADAAYAYALAVDRQRRLEEGRRSWSAFADAYRRDERAPDAARRVAWSLLEEMRYEEAAAAWSEVATRSAGTERERARWWAGWSAFRAGEFRQALDSWQPLAATAQLRYWRAACAEGQGDARSAREQWTRLHQDAPYEWYGLLAARRLGQPLVDATGRARGPSSGTRAGSAAVAAARAGLAAEARLMREQTRNLSETEQFEVEADPMAWVRARAALGDGRHQLPRTSADARAWAAAYPPYYRAAVLQFAEANDIPPALVWAIMQKESSYRADALSQSDAMGLMQVIPQTALAIAARLQTNYVDGELFEPRRAIRYGAWYLGALGHTFGEQGPLVLAGYNAGPVATRAWMERGAGLSLDVFVEEIAFEQARDYVRRVTGIMVGYFIAHGRDEVLDSPTLGTWMPETIESRWTGYVTF